MLTTQVVRCYFQIVQREKQKQSAESERLNKFKNWALQWWWCLQFPTWRCLTLTVYVWNSFIERQSLNCDKGRELLLSASADSGYFGNNV